MPPRFLIVDDEPGILKVLRALMGSLGGEAVTFRDSREAESSLSSEKFEGVVLDARMPHLDGFELTRRVRQSSLNHDTPIVLLTGMSDVATLRRGIQAGATCFLAKPFRREQVDAVINALRAFKERPTRRFARLPFRAAVHASSDENGKQRFRACSLNIGEGGMLLEAPRGVAAAGVVTLEFSLPAPSPSPGPGDPSSVQPATTPAAPSPRLDARVKFLRLDPPHRWAIEFIDLPPAARASIRRYIDGA